ncbi:MAG: diguanylate cyclase [Propionivibrio sp.]
MNRKKLAARSKPISLYQRVDTEVVASRKKCPSTDVPDIGAATLHQLRGHQAELRMLNESLLQANAALEESRQRYLDLYNFAPFGYLTLTHAGIIAEANLIAANLLDVAADQLVGQPFATFLGPDNSAAWKRFFARVALGSDHGEENTDFSLARKLADDGTEPPWVRVNCLRTRRKNPQSLIHVALTDISAMKRAEASLRESEARYHTIFNSTCNGLVLAEMGSRRLIGANTAFLAMIGCTHEQLSELDALDLFPENEMPRALESFVEAAGGRKSVVENIGVRRRDGSIFHADLNGTRLLLEGQPLVLGEFHDVSLRRWAEIALRDQEAFFRLIAENIDGFIAVLDTEGRRIYTSPSYARLLGEDPVVGADSFVNVHPDDRARVRQVFEETIASGVGQHLEYRFMQPDGGVRLMESRGGVIHGSDGRTKQVVVVSNDVTERYEADQKIHHLAFYDPLTQLPNRLTLTDRLQRAMAASKRNQRYGALMFVDLDNFKSVNDTHGHGTGDQLLVLAAERLSASVREIDTVARFGGDEFIVLLGELDVDLGASVRQAHRIAAKIKEAIAEPYVLETRADNGFALRIDYSCTASVGIALFRDYDHSEEDLLKLADRAMYRAKEEGRNAIHFYRGFKFETQF